MFGRIVVGVTHNNANAACLKGIPLKTLNGMRGYLGSEGLFWAKQMFYFPLDVALYRIANAKWAMGMGLKYFALNVSLP